MRRVLVTGATGFIGRHTLAPLVSRGCEVHGVSRRPRFPAAAGVTWHTTDLFDSVAVTAILEEVQPTHLLHLAWYAEPGKFWTSAENLRWVAASLELALAFHRAGGTRVVAAGTCAEYDAGADDCDERSTPTRPSTLYGTCKHAWHSMLASFAQGRMSYAWGRVFHLYGPHEYRDRLVPSVILALAAGEPALCTSGTQVRDFMHVRDVAGAFAALVDSDVSGAVNIASGEQVTVADVVTRIGDLMRSPHLVRLGARPSSPHDPPRLTANVQRLRNEVRWSPSLDLNRGLADSIAWWASGEADRRA